MSEDHGGAVEVLRGGAQDYLVCVDSLDGRGIARAVRYAIERKHTEQRLQALLNYDVLT